MQRSFGCQGEDRLAIDAAQAAEILSQKIFVALMLGQLAAGEHGAEGDDVIHRARVCSAADHRRLGAVAGLLTVDRKKLLDKGRLT